MSDLKRKCNNMKQAVSRAKSHIQSITALLVDLDVADLGLDNATNVKKHPGLGIGLGLGLVRF